MYEEKCVIKYYLELLQMKLRWYKSVSDSLMSSQIANRKKQISRFEFCANRYFKKQVTRQIMSYTTHSF